MKTGRGLSDMSMTSFQLHRLYYYTAIYTMLYIFRQSRRSGHLQDTFSWWWPPRQINNSSNRKQETGGNRDSLLEAKEPITTSGKSHRQQQQQQQQPKERGPRQGGPSSVWQAAAAATAEAHTPAVVTSADIQRALCRIPW